MTRTQPDLEKDFGQDRLVSLCDGRAGLRGGMRMKVAKTQAGSAPILDFIGSDDTLDRYDEVIDATGWKLDNYKKNPVFQNSHKYGDVLFTLGKSLITAVHGGKLFQRIEFATEVNPMAKIAYGLYSGGFLNAVSVGFIPLKWENGTDGLAGTPWRRKYLEQELLELSAVAIPANPNALVMGVNSGAVKRSDIDETIDLLRACGQKADSANGGAESSKALLRMAFQLGELFGC